MSKSTTIRRPVYKILASTSDENDDSKLSTANAVERYGVQVDSLVLMGSTLLTTAVVTAKARTPSSVANADDAAAATEDESKKLPDLDFNLPEASSVEVELVESFASDLKHAGYLDVPMAWLDAQRQRLGYKETSAGEANVTAAAAAAPASS
jgi:hypothetical protein